MNKSRLLASVLILVIGVLLLSSCSAANASFVDREETIVATPELDSATTIYTTVYSKVESHEYTHVMPHSIICEPTNWNGTDIVVFLAAQGDVVMLQVSNDLVELTKDNGYFYKHRIPMNFRDWDLLLTDLTVNDDQTVNFKLRIMWP